MDLEHPIDAAIRAWLKGHIGNERKLSLAIGRSSSWLHKYVNGDGQATIDDLVRLAGLLFGLNLPALTETERRLVKSVQGLEESDRQDVLAYAQHRDKLARRGQSKESSAPAVQTPQAIARKARGKR